MPLSIPISPHLFLFISQSLLVQEMFAALRKGMDDQVEFLVGVLLKRAGEVSIAGRENFIAQEADVTLSSIIASASPHRSLTTMLGQVGHKSPPVRTKVASKLEELLARHGQGLSQQALDQCLTALVKFHGEAAAETRIFARRAIYVLHGLYPSRSEFDRSLAARAANDSRMLQQVHQMLHDGPPPVPRPATRAPPTAGVAGDKVPGSRQGGARAPSRGRQEEAAAGAGRRNGTQNGTRNSNRGGGGGGGGGAGAGAGGGDGGGVLGQNGSGSGFGSGLGGVGAELSLETEERIAHIQAALGQHDFRQRQEGLRDLERLLNAAARPAAPGGVVLTDAALVRCLEGLVARVTDGNTKVSAQALEVSKRLFPVLQAAVCPALNLMVPALAAGMGSTNERIRVRATEAIKTLTQSLEPTLLVQHMAHCVSHSMGRGKAPLVEILAGLVEPVYARRPQLVVRHVVPAALTLLSDVKTDVKSANQVLLQSLHAKVGAQLQQSAAMLSAPLRAQLELALTASM